MTDLYKKYAPPFKERIYIPEWFYNDNRFPSSFDVIRDECFIEITNSEQWIPKSLIRKKD